MLFESFRKIIDNSSRFSGNSEAFASELQENSEEIFIRYYICV